MTVTTEPTPAAPPDPELLRRHRLGWTWSIGLVVYGLSMLLVYNGGEKWVLTRHEVLAAEPAREMLELGNWVVPTIAGVPRENKPPTTGWFIAASMAIFRSDAEWVARLPPALAAVVASLLMGGMAARWLGRLAGGVAGLMQLTFLYVLMQARLAEADMLLGAAVAGAMYAFAATNIDSPVGRSSSKWLPPLFYFATGLAFLLKLLIGPAVILGGCAVYLLWSRDRRVLRFLLDPVGLIVFAVMLIAWPVAAYVQHPPILDIWIRENFGRFLGKVPTKHQTDVSREPPWYYLYTVPAMLLPWVFWMIPGLLRSRELGWHRSQLGRFLVCWVLPGFVLLTASAWKAKHYAIPILPPFTILAAGGMLAFISFQYRQSNPRHGLIAILWAVGWAAGAIAVWRYAKPAGGQMAVVMLVLMLGGLAVIWFEHRKQRASQLGAIFATAWLVAVGIQVLIMPHHDIYRPSADFARRANAIVPPTQPMYLFGLGEAHVSYYLRFPMKRADELEQVRQVLEEAPPGPVYALTRIGMLADLPGRVEVQDRCPKISRSEREQDQVVLVLVSR